MTGGGISAGTFVIHWTLDSGADAILKASIHDNAVTAFGRLARVDLIHAGASPPLVNLDNGETSVPHQSYVASATHGFYTEGPVVLGGKAELP